MVKRFWMVTAAMFMTAVGLLALPGVAGASPSPCPGIGGNNGWFDAYGNGKHYALNCSIDGNHIVIDAWDGGNYSQGVVDMWHRTDLAPIFGYDGSGYFRIYFAGYPNKVAWQTVNWTSNQGNGTQFAVIQGIGPSGLGRSQATPYVSGGGSDYNTTINPNGYAIIRSRGTNNGVPNVDIWLHTKAHYWTTSPDFNYQNLYIVPHP